MPVSSARSHIYYSNQIVSLPDLEAKRPEGKMEMALISNERTQDYYFRFLSSIDVKIARSMAPTNAQRAIDSLILTQPPLIDCEIWGRWRDHEHIGVKGQILVTNFTFRSESATYFHTLLDYTNEVLDLKDGRLERTNQLICASSLRLDFRDKRAYVTNGFSALEPMLILRTIGPKWRGTWSRIIF